jgi:hypothetical protein
MRAKWSEAEKRAFCASWIARRKERRYDGG